MCGFVGYMVNKPSEVNENEKIKLKEMINAIGHRGPDDIGYFTDRYVRFGFRRLSIIDLEMGHQPLSYENERYWIVFNGEIYNYLELRKQLMSDGHAFETDSDTEVIVALYACKREQALLELRGMFSFLIWDKQEEELFGARDPFGIKPFFYTEKDTGLYCASEMKSLLYLQGNDEGNLEGLHDYFSYQYIPEPHTMLSAVKRLEPGSFFRKKPGELMQIKAYWKPVFKPKNYSIDQQTKRIRETLRDAVRLHMRSDVPVGAFLSGGVDSSAIVALAREINPDMKTFTVGFERTGYSEIDIAKDTAKQLNVTNFHYVIRPEEFVRELPNIIRHMDDPVADPAAVPLYFVAREARKHVKVVLSGEGADELFGGYNIYREPEDLKIFSRMPQPLKTVLRSLSEFLPEGMFGKSFLERGTTPLQDRFIGNAKLCSEIEKTFLIKDYRPAYCYSRITKPLYRQIQHYSEVHQMQYIDLHTWLRGDILVKADRMTMAHSLELRVPFLDREVFRIASELKSTHTVTKRTTKYALREAMRGIVPNSVLYNKKLGFPVPIRHWLKKELYEWAIQIIRTSPTDHLIRKSYVLHLLETHRLGKTDYSRKLWAVLVFMIWHRLYIEESPITQKMKENVLQRNERIPEESISH